MTTIEDNVMRRVRRIHIFYAVFSGVSAVVLLGVLSLYGIGREVWVAMVFQNGPQDFVGHAGYLLYAFTHTQFIVQLLCLVVAASLVYLARETAKVISSAVAPARV